MPIQKSEATIVIKYYDGKPEVHINGFEKLKPSLIDKGYDEAQRAWNTLRSQAVMKSKKGLLKEQIEAANAKEEKEETENVG